jgi:hypothetical protein
MEIIRGREQQLYLRLRAAHKRWRDGEGDGAVGRRILDFVKK